MKDMTSYVTTTMTEEEKAEIEKEMNAGNLNTSAGATSIAVDEHNPAGTENITPKPVSNGEPTESSTTAPPTNKLGDVKDNGGLPPSPSTTSTPTKTSADKERERQEQLRRKAEQRERLREHEVARRKALEERVKILTQKMIERLRPFVEAKNPGGEGDTETTAFAEKMKREVEDLKLESFGIEVFVDLILLLVFNHLMPP